MNFKESNYLFEIAKNITPLASQTYSKSYRYFPLNACPLFLKSGKGQYVWDVDGNKYCDFICALGTITLGYVYPEVDSYVMKQMQNGVSFSLPHPIEAEVIKKIIHHVPSAEMVRFVKNGSDATSAAIRLARAYTEKEVVACCGYHGFHDWYIGCTENNLGVPKTCFLDHLDELVLK